MISHTEKAAILVETLPYIQRFDGKVFLIKYGGKAMVNESLKRSVIEDVVLLKQVGINPVIVHGGGPEISAAMKAANLEPKFVNGLRATDSETMEIVEKTFSKINLEICSIMKECGGKPLSFSGRDNTMFLADAKDEKLGFVGKIAKVNPVVVLLAARNGYIPVISPIGVGKDNNLYNVNADTAAAALAVALKAEKMTLLTDVEGVLENGKLISSISFRGAESLIKSGVISGGMIPKVEACISAVKGGCNKAYLIDGTLMHSMLLEIFTNEGVGTEIVK
mgnify:CR=1 FL=1